MLQNIPKEKIIEVLKQGPTYPSKVAKQLGAGGDTMLVGAILSTLISSGDVKVSALKVGGSPLYYVPDQESKLEDFLSYLNDKDKNTFRLLKEQKILQDSEQDPLVRVSLRTIKDFARPFEMDLGGRKELFWRFYSVSSDEASQIARSRTSDIRSMRSSMKDMTEQQENVPASAPVARIEPISIQKGPIADDSGSTGQQQVYQQMQQPIQQPIQHVQQVLEPVVAESHVQTSESQAHAHHDLHKTHHTEHHTHDSHDSSRHAKKEKPEKKENKENKPEYDFFTLLLNHISSKNLDLISKEKIKKTEYDLVVKNHSNNEYIYCKAKDKSSISEGDLAPALIFAQNKKMPCIFLATGDLTKKAESMMGKEFSGIAFEKIEVKHG